VKLPEAMKKAAREGDARTAGKIADLLRYKFGMNYSQVSAKWCEATGQRPEQFEELMQLSDEIESGL